MLQNFSLIIFILSLLFSWVFVNFSKKFAITHRILDDPSTRPDKLQKQPIPLLGGLGIVVSGSVLMAVVWLTNKYNIWNLSDLLNTNLHYYFHLVWILVGFAIITIAGFLDDKYTLSSKWMILSTSIAVGVSVVGGGLKIETFSAPFNILPNISFLPQVLAFVWIMSCLAATKFLDGHDGMASSVSLVTLLSIASVSLFDNVFQPLVFVFAIIWIGILSVFLIFNFPDAKIYLGEIGSEALGFIIGILSILSGAKVATASSVIGWFILDILLVLLLRKINRKPIFKADRSHWHHRLLSLGFSKLQVLVLTVLILIFSAQIGLIAPTPLKIWVIPTQLIILLITIFYTKKKIS